MTDYVDLITEKCREYYHEKSLLSPSQMAVKIMAAEGFPMHSTHHHYLVPAVLITAACIAENKDEDTFSEYLGTAEKRGMKVPGGYCGEYGACGAAIGCGIFMSIWNHTTPMSHDTLGPANAVTGKALEEIGRYPGPRCCKRVTYAAIEEGVEFIRDNLGIDLRQQGIICPFSKRNEDECLKERCGYYKK